jgi:hypothetical protein
MAGSGKTVMEFAMRLYAVRAAEKLVATAVSKYPERLSQRRGHVWRQVVAWILDPYSIPSKRSCQWERGSPHVTLETALSQESVYL